MNQRLRLTYTPQQIEIFFGAPGNKFHVIPKGRRFGATQGGIHAFIEWAAEGITPLLWVDTINSNIDRYVERYASPVLKQLPSDVWSWNSQRKILKIFNGLIDFRSADAPESIEGFGYRKIMLNEAGIILRDDYLYSNTILPMLLDYPDSELFAIGVPKGKLKKDGSRHKFYELYDRAIKGSPGYRLKQYTSYDNPLLDPKEIEAIAAEMNEFEYQQEIMGQFVEYAGENPFAHQYDDAYHSSENARFVSSKQLYISVDFNINPFGAIFSHIWRDKDGFHFHTFESIEISNGSISKMVDEIRTRFNNQLPSCYLTGDAQGKSGNLATSDASGYFEQLRRGLGLRHSQILVTGNPSHENSRADCNYLLYHAKSPGIDVKVNPKTAAGLARDLKTVQCDAFGKIQKRNRNILNQRADLLDCWRYSVNTFIKKFIQDHQRSNTYKKPTA